jgi:hypothetical protein
MSDGRVTGPGERLSVSERERFSGSIIFPPLCWIAAAGDWIVETRLLIAYMLIAALVIAGMLLARHVARKRHEHRYMMRGRRYYRKRT